MTFSPPSQLKDMVIYWWKIIDRPQIPKDYLINYISFDLSMYSLPNTRKILEQAINRNYLTYNIENDMVSLSKPLEEEFEDWQKRGFEKSQKMRNILNKSWREKMEISDEMLFQVLLNDMVDESVKKQAKKIRNKDFDISTTDFDGEIKGIFKEEIENGKEIPLPFSIKPKNREIIHKCPIYASNYKSKKNFCSHLARIIMKLFPKNKDETIKLLDDMVTHKENWKFL